MRSSRAASGAEAPAAETDCDEKRLPSSVRSGGHGRSSPRPGSPAASSGPWVLDDEATARRGSWASVEAVLDVIRGRQGRVGVALGSARTSTSGLLRAPRRGRTHCRHGVHPSAWWPPAILGIGSYVGPLPSSRRRSRGRACIVNSGPHRARQCPRRRRPRIPGATWGDVILGDNVHVGLGASVLPGITSGTLGRRRGAS